MGFNQLNLHNTSVLAVKTTQQPLKTTRSIQLAEFYIQSSPKLSGSLIPIMLYSPHSDRTYCISTLRGISSSTVSGGKKGMCFKSLLQRLRGKYLTSIYMEKMLCLKYFWITSLTHKIWYLKSIWYILWTKLMSKSMSLVTCTRHVLGT
jgi:hypothetical protein